MAVRLRGFRGRSAQAEGRINGVKEHHARGDQEYRAETVVGGHRGAYQGAGDVANIAERLVIAKDTPGDLAGGLIHKQGLHRRQQCPVCRAEQETQDTQLQWGLNERHRDQQ